MRKSERVVETEGTVASVLYMQREEKRRTALTEKCTSKHGKAEQEV
jgi:hypothetical protein